MNGIQVKNEQNSYIITIDKSIMDFENISIFLERLRLEQLAKKANFKDDILSIADEIKKSWGKINA